jgi:hypothetical protein
MSGSERMKKLYPWNVFLTLEPGTDRATPIIFPTFASNEDEAAAQAKMAYDGEHNRPKLAVRVDYVEPDERTS